MRGGFVMRFEEKKFCQIRTVADRWDCSMDRIYDCLSKGLLKAWHPEGKPGRKGVMIDVASVLEVEERGYLVTSLCREAQDDVS
jgi:hypothetical protein